MRKALGIALLSLALLLVAGAGSRVSAQDYIQVTGNVYNSNALADRGSGHKYQYYAGVIIYIYETEAEGNQAHRRLLTWIKKHQKGSTEPFDPGMATYKDLSEGTDWPYTLNAVSPEGALLFFDVFTQSDCKLVKVKGRSSIDVMFAVKSEGIMQEIAETVITVERGPRLRIEPPVEYGDTIKLNKGYLFPAERMGKPDARFALQSYIISPVDTTDTMEFRKAMVMDGQDYHDTQLRRMGYDGARDPLFLMAEKYPPLTDTTSVVYMSDKIYKGPKSRGGLIMADVWFEDYNQVYYSEKVELEDLRRTSKPMQFLEYTLKPIALDPNDPVYKRTPEKSLIPGDMQLPIAFEQGKAVVNTRDSMSMVYMDSLRNTVYNITHAEGSHLQKYRIEGLASPEGGYAKNVSLAKERLIYIEKHVRSAIPPEAFISMRAPETSSRVASWTDFADTLGKDTTYRAYADQIRDIAARYPGQLDVQNAHIRKLPYYNTIIKDNLHRLRLVNFYYTQLIFREKTVQEVIDMLHHDPLYQTADRGENFTAAEFWVLMQHLKDTTELEAVCRRAIRQDNKKKQKIYQKWAFPANVLATVLIAQNRPDTTVLAPYIDENERVDRPYKEEGKQYRLNATPVVANQVCMMLLSEHYTRAVQLAEMLRFSSDPYLQSLYATARCKAGYFNPNTPAGEKYYNMIHDTSPRNAVVMDMAIPTYKDAVRGELEELNPEDPVTPYLKAQFECYEYYVNSGDNTFNLIPEETRHYAIRCLVNAFMMDPGLIDVAASDWFIFKGLYEESMKEYNNPGSVLPTEEEPAAEQSAAEEFTHEKKVELIMKSINHPEEMTDEEWELYDKYDLGNYSI